MSEIRSILKEPSTWLIIFMLTSLLIGLNIFQDFGISFDEPSIHRFTPVALEMYATAFDPPSTPIFQRESFLYRKGIDPILFHYGPFYFMFVELFSRGLHELGLDLPSWDLWHLTYFLTFEACIAAFYLLSRRWLSGWASLGATLLFATQPVILGHVFINPKDPPFMFFFIATVLTGLIMVDKIASQPSDKSQPKLEGLVSVVKMEWETRSQETLAKTRRQLGALGSMVVFILLATPLWRKILYWAVAMAYAALPESFLGKLLRIFSGDPEKIPLENFILKGQIWFNHLELLIVLLIIVRAIWLLSLLLPSSSRSVAQIISLPFHDLFRCLINPIILAAGILFGLTMSIRLFAPLAGGIVILYLLWKLRWRGLIPALVYACTALLTTYLTWPYLWGAPIRRLIKSWNVMNEFSHPGSRASLPAFLGIQYTEPAVILAVLGIIIAVLEINRKNRVGLILLFLCWTALPISVLTLQQKSLYDNDRQILFILPPFFIILGVAMEKILNQLRHPVAIISFILLVIAPGIYTNIKLHPYEYVYYNQFASGVGGGFRHYQTDYWSISFKETANYLNMALPPNTGIIVCGPLDSLTPYLRSDFSTHSDCSGVSAPEGNYKYAVISTRYNYDKLLFPQAKVIFSVGRENAIFSVVKSLNGPAKQ